MNYTLCFTWILMILSGCFSSGYQSPNYVKLAHQITDDTAEKLEKQKKLFLIGIGGGMMNDIQMMAMGFKYYQEVDLNESRDIMLYVINEYLNAINNNEDVRPFLHDYPFTAKNIEIRIWISKPDRTNPDLDKIEYVSAIDGVLGYYIAGKDKYSSKRIHEESYQDALKAVHFEIP